MNTSDQEPSELDTVDEAALNDYLRRDSAGGFADTRYNLVSRDEAHYARSYDPGGDGDLYEPYASRTGGGYYGGPNGAPGYDDRGYVNPGSMFQQRGPFGGIFGDQRYFEQQENNRQRQRRVDPDYFIDRFRTN